MAARERGCHGSKGQSLVRDRSGAAGKAEVVAAERTVWSRQHERVNFGYVKPGFEGIRTQRCLVIDIEKLLPAPEEDWATSGLKPTQSGPPGFIAEATAM